MHKSWLLLLALVALPVWPQQPGGVASAPAATASDWVESTPAEQGMDSAAMDRLQRHLLAGAAPAIRSVLVVRHDRLVFEYYREGVRRDDLQQVNSVTKSIVSALVGIALQRGVLRGLDQKLADLLPEASAPGVDRRVRDITIGHLLTMSAGFAWDEKARDACRGTHTGECARFDDSGDPTVYALRRPMAHAPGTVFNYDSPSVDLLAVALARAAKKPLQAYAEEVLGRDLGITRLRWATDPQGNALGGRGIQATPRDLAKFGNLYLRQGSWRGKALIPAVYVDASTREQIAGGWPWPPWVKYGYLWWVLPGPAPSYTANGFGGQYVWVMPSRDAVVVITADPFNPRDVSPLVRDFIGPAFGGR